MTEEKGYKNIFKSTFLFGFVKIIQIFTGIIKNKFVAVLLGPEGVGIIGILMNTVNLIQSGAGLGISQSAVRDISEANYSNDNSKFSRIISLTNKIIIYTCFLGIILTVILSPLLSKWTFGNDNYVIAYIWMALVVGLNILSDGQLAILKGMRQLNALAKASLIGSIVGLITAVPMYFFFGKSGIVPSLIITAFSAIIFSNYYVRKIKYNKTTIPFKDLKKEAGPMLKMGAALMLVGFLGLLFDLIIAAYIRSKGGLETVGYYRAGATIISSYFGIVLSAMTTDYYPRISAVNNDNIKLKNELIKQTEVGLILIFPIAVLFAYLSPLIIRLLYSNAFINAINYTDFAIIATIIVVSSNNMGMILLAKQEAKIFTIYSVLHRIFFILIYFVLYNNYGLIGLGLSYLIDIIIQFIFYDLIVAIRYKIFLNLKFYLQLTLIISVTIIAILVRNLDHIILRYVIGGCLFLFSVLYSNIFMKKTMGIDIFEYAKNIKKKNK